MYKLLCKIEDPEAGKTVFRYLSGLQIIEIIVDIGTEPSAADIRDADPRPETPEERTSRLAKDRAKANKSTLRSYRIKK